MSPASPAASIAPSLPGTPVEGPVEAALARAAAARDRARVRILAPLLLAAIAFAVFREGFEHEFTNFDDVHYIVQNPLVHGFSLDRVKDAFTRFHVFNYNPLHIVSYMVDYELWGLDAAGFFLTSLSIHIAGGILVYFLALHWLRSAWQAFWVASVFLIHPTRVESVAWLSERKDVLSGAFAAASLLLYSKWLDAPPSSGRTKPALLAGSFLAFLLALLSKSQVLLLPLVLLAMDACRRRPLRRALAGKAPFLLLGIVFGAVTIRAHEGEASLGMRLPDAILDPLAALPRYVLDLVAPLRLTPYHDHTQGGFHGALPVALGVCLIALVAAASAASWRRERVLLLGTVWFLALLAPVLGFFKIRVSFADRYLYLAAVGPALAFAHAILSTRRFRGAAAALQGASLIAMALLTMSYLPVFRDSEALWSRVLEAYPGSSLAHSSLAGHLVGKGRFAEAASHYDADLAERPFYETSILGRALLFEEAGDRDAARRLHELAIQHRPGSVLARIHHADFLERGGEHAAAVDVLLGIEPAARNAGLHRRLSEALRGAGRAGDAATAARAAVEMDPHDPRGWLALARAEEALGSLDAARAACTRALEMAPGWKAAEEVLERLGTPR
jgi:tetratricopeptide (TPR) repeat protein